MAAKFALGRYRFNSLTPTLNPHSRARGLSGEPPIASTLRLDTVSRRYLLTVLPVSTLAMPDKPDEQLPSRYHPPLATGSAAAGRGPASGVWSPPCGPADRVLGSEMRTRFSPGRRPRAGVQGLGAGISRPAIRSPASGARGSRVRLWVLVSEPGGPRCVVAGEILRRAARKRPSLLGTIRQAII